MAWRRRRGWGDADPDEAIANAAKLEQIVDDGAGAVDGDRKANARTA